MVIRRIGQVLNPSAVCLAIVGLVAAVALSACGSSASPTTTSTTKVAPLPPTAVSTADIKHAYETLFDLANPQVAPKLAVVQEGSTLDKAMSAALASSFAKLAGGATVSSITILQGTSCSNALLPSPCAKVVYTVLTPKGKTLLANTAGYAVWTSGHWLVAKATICGLLQLAGTKPSCP